MSLHTTSQKCKFAFRNGTKLGPKMLAIAKFYYFWTDETSERYD